MRGALGAALLLAALGSAACLYDKGGAVTQVTTHSFDKVEQSAVPVVVVSGGSWRRAAGVRCRALKPRGSHAKFCDAIAT